MYLNVRWAAKFGFRVQEFPQLKTDVASETSVCALLGKIARHTDF